MTAPPPSEIASSAMSGTGADPDVERRLAELEAESDRRRTELVELAQGLPAEVSRREVLRDSIVDLRTTSGLATAARRAWSAALAIAGSVAARVRTRLARR